MSPSPPVVSPNSRGAPSARLNGLLTYVLRPVYLFIVFVVVVAAIVQVAGRVSMLLLPQFTDEINQQLEQRQILLEGVRGDWRGFNPVVRVQTVVFPAGHVQALEFELDLLESAWRSVLVPARVQVEDLTLNLVQTASGWALEGMTGDAELPDLAGTLRHIDDLGVTSTVVFKGTDETQNILYGNLQLTNIEAQHHLLVELRAAESAESLALELWQDDEVFYNQTAQTAVVVTGALKVPELLTGMPDLLLEVSDGYWADREGYGGGGLGLNLRGLDIPGVDTALEAEMTLAAQRRSSRVSAILSNLKVKGAREALDLSGIRLGLDVGEPPSVVSDWLTTNELQVPLVDEADNATISVGPSPMLRVWVEELSLEAVTRFFNQELSGWEPAGRWVASLALRGDLLNVQAFVDPGGPLLLGYAATLSDLHMQGYKGAPTLLGGQGQLWGHAQGAAVQLSADDVQLQFPDLFDNLWQVGHIQGVVKAWFQSGYFALQGNHLKAEVEGSQVAGSFSLTRPDERFEQRVGLTLNLDAAELNQTRRFIPYKIPAELSRWLEYGPQAGLLSEIQFAYHGQVHVRPGELGRRIELMSRMRQGAVVYQSDWPIVTDLDAKVHVAGVQTRVAVTSGVTQGTRLGGSNITLHDNGAYADGRVQASADGAQLLEFVRHSPLADSLSFVSPQWQAAGAVSLAGNLMVPIKTEIAPPLAVELEFTLAGLDLDMPEYRTVLTDLQGGGEFSLPHNLQGEFTSLLFDQPSQIHARSEGDWVKFDIAGRASPADVYTLINNPDIGILKGEFDFQSTLNLSMSPELVTHIEVASDLTGLTINLPAEFAKAATEEVPTELNVQFLNDYQSVSWLYKTTQGWLHFGDEVERGALGIGQSPPMTDRSQRAISIAGKMPRLRLSDWVSTEGESRVSLPLDWVIRDLEIDRFILDELEFEDLVLNGEQIGNRSRFEFVSPVAVGDIAIPAAGPMTIALDYLRLPDPETVLLGGVPNALELVQAPATEPSFSLPIVDPIPLAAGQALPVATVTVDQLVIGSAPFGRWSFEIVPDGEIVRFEDFAVDVNGVHVSGGSVSWDLLNNVSSFDGRVVLDDLQTTLPQWDYAASVQTSEAALRVNGSWNGSPANVSLLGLNGEMLFAADDGRFLDVASAGGLRIMSLLNFSNIAKRMALDFSDVTKNGLAFEKIRANVNIEDGQLTFLERMRVESSSSNFEVGGNVDLNNGLLDNEMIVTLPVSDSLPWYGVYIGLANPLAGLGVIIGERVLRKPIEAFSTAKFEVKGTLEEPQVTFVSLWDRSISAPPVAPPAAQTTPAVETELPVPVDAETLPAGAGLTPQPSPGTP